MSKTDFAQLHVHTEYSLMDSTIRIEKLLKKAKALNMPALAITDHGNMFGAIEFYQAAHNVGIKPIIGCEVYITTANHIEPLNNTDFKRGSHHLVILAMNQEGYRNLVQLVSYGYLEGFYYNPCINKELLGKYNNGLIALSGCLHGEIPQSILAGDMSRAFKIAEEFKANFSEGRFYLEIQDNGLAQQKVVNEGLTQISKKLSIPLVATNNCHYLNAFDARAHEVLLCIRTGKTINNSDRMRFATNEFYFKSPEQMGQVFPHVPEALKNTMDIAEKCNLQIPCKEYSPEFVAEIDTGSRENTDNWIKDKFTKGNAAYLARFEKMCGKELVQDVGHSLNIPSDKLNEILLYITDDKTISLGEIIARNPELKKLVNAESHFHELITVSNSLDGLTSHTSVNRFAAVIFDEPLINHLPLYRSAKGELITQYSGNDVVDVGFMVFDLREMKVTNLYNCYQGIQIELKERLLEGLKDLNEGGCISISMDFLPRPYFDYKDMQTLLNRAYEAGLTVWGIDCMTRDAQDRWGWDMTEHADDYPDEDINKWFLDAFRKMIEGLKLDNCLNNAAFYCSISKLPRKSNDKIE